MKMKGMFFGIVLLALMASACGSAMPIYSTSANNPPATSGPTAAPTALVPVTGSTPATAPTAVMPAAGSATSGPASAGTAVAAGQNAKLGSILVDSKGMTLYVFANDAMNTSNCTGSCATVWPPLLTNGAPTAGTGVNASLLGTIKRADGGTQVTYNGLPLYTFVNDKVPGNATGQGVQSFFVINSAGMTITTMPAAAGSGSGSSGSGSSMPGYGPSSSSGSSGSGSGSSGSSSGGGSSGGGYPGYGPAGNAPSNPGSTGSNSGSGGW